MGAVEDKVKRCFRLRSLPRGHGIFEASSRGDEP